MKLYMKTKENEKYYLGYDTTTNIVHAINKEKDNYKYLNFKENKDNSDMSIIITGFGTDYTFETSVEHFIHGGNYPSGSLKIAKKKSDEWKQDFKKSSNNSYNITMYIKSRRLFVPAYTYKLYLCKPWPHDNGTYFVEAFENEREAVIRNWRNWFFSDNLFYEEK